jgi:ornithine carbamoyltransferase
MRIQNFTDMNFKNHYLVGFVWPVTSTRTGESYKVTMTDLGFSCNCMAGSMRGKCKHAQQVHDLLVADDYPLYKGN